MSTKKGGHPVDEFVHSHFTTVGEKTASKRWNMRCKYCPNTANLIMHRDSRCLTHLAKTGEGFCLNAPPEVRAEARQRLMAKGGLEIPESTSDVEISEVGTSSTASKKAKVSETGVLITKRGIDAFLERAMTEHEKDIANVRMMRCMHICYSTSRI
jgi:hypothetical protein